jgi:hypothetical protein
LVPLERNAVAAERSKEYLALLTGLSARRALFTGLGVSTRLADRTGWAARRTLRGTRSRLKKPTVGYGFIQCGCVWLPLQTYLRPLASHPLWP